MIAPPWLSRAQLRLSDQDDCGYDVKFAAIGRKWGIRVVVIGADAERNVRPFFSCRSHIGFSSDSSGFDSLLERRYCVRRCSQLRFFALVASQAQRYARTDDIITYVCMVVKHGIYVYPCDVGVDMTYDLPTHHSRVVKAKRRRTKLPK